MKTKYLVCPGKVRSQSDGEFHHITAGQLITLYKVNTAECNIVDESRKDSWRGLDWGAYIILRPRTDGDYSLPVK